MPLFGFRKDKKQVKDYSKAITPALKVVPAKMAKIPTASKKPTISSKEVVVPKKSAPILPSGSFSSSSDAIFRPRITEKSGVLSQGGVYTFEVTKSANKNSVAQAVKALYKVTPLKIAMLNNPAKSVFVRGRRGVVPGVRKALVTLKKGDKIDFV